MYHSVKLDMCMHGRKLTTCKFNFSPSLPNASSFPVTPAPSPPRQFRISSHRHNQFVFSLTGHTGV